MSFNLAAQGALKFIVAAIRVISRVSWAILRSSMSSLWPTEYTEHTEELEPEDEYKAVFNHLWALIFTHSGKYECNESGFAPIGVLRG
jgi:hypothetical protein